HSRTSAEAHRSPTSRSPTRLNPPHRSPTRLNPPHQSQTRLNPPHQSQTRLSPTDQSQARLSPTHRSPATPPSTPQEFDAIRFPPPIQFDLGDDQGEAKLDPGLGLAETFEIRFLGIQKIKINIFRKKNFFPIFKKF